MSHYNKASRGTSLELLMGNGFIKFEHFYLYSPRILKVCCLFVLNQFISQANLLVQKKKKVYPQTVIDVNIQPTKVYLLSVSVFVMCRIQLSLISLTPLIS